MHVFGKVMPPDSWELKGQRTWGSKEHDKVMNGCLEGPWCWWEEPAWRRQRGALPLGAVGVTLHMKMILHLWAQGQRFMLLISIKLKWVFWQVKDKLSKPHCLWYFWASHMTIPPIPHCSSYNERKQPSAFHVGAVSTKSTARHTLSTFLFSPVKSPNYPHWRKPGN